MYFPIRENVRLSGGTVTLRAWGATVADAHLSDLLTLTVTLGAMRDEWQEFQHGDMEPGIWDTFWRLVNASLEAGCILTQSLTWNDRLSLLTALYSLNDVEEAEGKLMALIQRSAKLLRRIQGQTAADQMIPHLTNLSSGSSAPSPTPAS